MSPQFTPLVTSKCQGPRAGFGEVDPQLASHASMEKRGTPPGVLKEWPLFTRLWPRHLRVTGQTIHSHLELCYQLCDGKIGHPPLCIQGGLSADTEGLRTCALLLHRHLWEHPHSRINAAQVFHHCWLCASVFLIEPQHNGGGSAPRYCSPGEPQQNYNPVFLVSEQH